MIIDRARRGQSEVDNVVLTTEGGVKVMLPSYTWESGLGSTDKHQMVLLCPSACRTAGVDETTKSVFGRAILMLTIAVLLPIVTTPLLLWPHVSLWRSVCTGSGILLAQMLAQVAKNWRRRTGRNAE